MRYVCDSLCELQNVTLYWAEKTVGALRPHPTPWLAHHISPCPPGPCLRHPYTKLSVDCQCLFRPPVAQCLCPWSSNSCDSLCPYHDSGYSQNIFTAQHTGAILATASEWPVLSPGQLGTHSCSLWALAWGKHMQPEAVGTLWNKIPYSVWLQVSFLEALNQHGQKIDMS